MSHVDARIKHALNEADSSLAALFVQIDGLAAQHARRNVLGRQHPHRPPDLRR